MPPEIIPGPPGPIHVEAVIQRLPDGGITKGVAAGASGIHVGVYGSSESNTGVYAESKTSNGLYATGKPAGQFDGDVAINGNLAVTGNLTLNGSLEGSHQIQGDLVLTGDIRFTDAADCAEDFTIGSDLGVAPGTV